MCLIRGSNPLYYTDGVYPYKMTWTAGEDCGGCVEVCVGRIVPRHLEAYAMVCRTVGPGPGIQLKTEDDKFRGNIERCLERTPDSAKVECIGAVVYIGLPD